MCRIDYADSEGFWLRDPSPIRASKDHKCEDCGRPIEKGELYTYGVWKEYAEKSRIFPVKVCAHCDLAGRWLRVVCGGHLWPGITEELVEHWDEEWELRSLGLGRLVVSLRRHWKYGDGRQIALSDVEAWVTDALAHVPEEAKRAA